MSPLSASDLASHYADIQSRIRAAAAGREVTLIAVSKTQPVEAIEALYRLGQRDFGENYVQELAAKATELRSRGCTEIRWHFIGHLQTNKVKQLLPFVHAVHTVDSDRLARELAKRWSALSTGRKLPVFLEVNIDEEEGKSGLKASDAPALAEFVARDPAVSGALSLEGLMCIPDPDLGEEAMRQAFARLRELGRGLPSSGRLSMGMSGDFETAIREGATHVRVGTALFGARSQA